MMLGYPRPSLSGIGVPCVLTGTPPMCLDAQGGTKAKRQPLCGWCCLVVMCLGRHRRDVLSCTFLSDVRTEYTYTPCSTGSAVHKLSVVTIRTMSRIRGSRFLATDCVLNPSKLFRVEICSVVLLEVRVVLLLCTGPVQPGRCSSRASSSR